MLKQPPIGSFSLRERARVRGFCSHDYSGCFAQLCQLLRLPYGDSTLPMDEALLLAAVDISGRGRLCSTLCPPTQKVGTFDIELANEFFDALACRAGMTVHLRQLAGENSHHIIEGSFKALAHALKTAVAIDEKNRDVIPSTKGVL